jgi:hypothetical protein
LASNIDQVLATAPPLIATAAASTRAPLQHAPRAAARRTRAHHWQLQKQNK